MIRITPAHAGNRSWTKDSSQVAQDHPRSCGEQGYNYSGKTVGPGSPPLMRGTVGFGVGRTPQAGITPAHAGNSPQNNTLSLGLEDHPRSCGEQLEHHCFTLLTTGSPPLMRGTVLITQQLAGGPRITPAHAGNSQFPPSRPLSCRDHPRSCGEQLPSSLVA